MKKIIKFFCDRDVYKLAKHLRFAGFDVMTRKELSLQKINFVCDKDKRIFLSRKKSNKGITTSKIQILSNCINEQLAQVFKDIPFDPENIGTRCMICNVLLQKTQFGSGIKYCSRCGRKYWKGTHYKAMTELLVDSG